MLTAALTASAVAFSPIAPAMQPRVALERASTPVCSLGRRDALLAGMAALPVLTSMPLAALADAESDNEEAMARIAAKANAANEAAKARTQEAIAAKTAKRMAKIQAGQKVVDEDEEAKAAAKQQILLIAGGGTLASTAFFYRNIQRLFIKFTSGGEDSGYNSIPEPGSKRAQAQAGRRGRGKPAPEPEPEPSLGDAAKKWAEFAFGRKL